MLTSTLSKEALFIDIQDEPTLAHAIVDAVRDPVACADEMLVVWRGLDAHANTP